MRHGTELRVLRDGIQVSLKALEPLGIYDGSRCWGLWVRGQDEDTFRRESPHKVQPNHLVISPIHPSAWVSAFHLELKLAERPGALRSACRILRDHGVNVLFSDGAPSGYSHATFNAVCEMGNVRSWGEKVLESRDALRRPGCTREPVKELQFRRIGASMVLAMAQLWARMRDTEHQLYLNDEEAAKEARKRSMRGSGIEQPLAREHFLYPRIVESGSEPWYLAESDMDAIGKVLATSGRRLPEELFRLHDGSASFEWDAQAPSRRKGEPKAARKGLFECLNSIATTLRKAYDRTVVRDDKDRSRSEWTTTVRLTEESNWLRRLGAGDDPDPTRALQRLMRHFLRQHWFEPLGVRALLALAYSRVFSAGLEPIRFRYDARSALLRIDGDEAQAIMEEGLSRMGSHRVTLPTLAIASFHRTDRFVRLQLIEPQVAKTEIVRIDVEYDISRRRVPDWTDDQPAAEADPDADPSSHMFESPTLGLLADVTHNLATRATKFSIARISNHITETWPRRERGRVRIVGRFDPDAMAAGAARSDSITLRRQLQAELEATIRTFAGSNSLILHDGRALVEPLREFRVFLSMPGDAVRCAETERIIRDEGALLGCEIVRVVDPITHLNPTVEEEMRSSDAVLQVVALRRHEHHRSIEVPGFNPQFDWLHFEYGLAQGIGLPVIRVLDESMPTRIARDQFTFDRDRPVHAYRSNDDEEAIRRCFSKALGLLTAHLVNRS